MAKCFTCDYCINITETYPYGTCTFFPKGHKQVLVNKEGCSNHSEEQEEERELERQYYESKRR